MQEQKSFDSSTRPQELVAPVLRPAAAALPLSGSMLALPAGAACRWLLKSQRAPAVRAGAGGTGGDPGERRNTPAVWRSSRRGTDEHEALLHSFIQTCAGDQTCAPTWSAEACRVITSRRLTPVCSPMHRSGLGVLLVVCRRSTHAQISKLAVVAEQARGGPAADLQSPYNDMEPSLFSGTSTDPCRCHLPYLNSARRSCRQVGLLPSEGHVRSPPISQGHAAGGRGLHGDALRHVHRGTSADRHQAVCTACPRSPPPPERRHSW